MTEALRPKGSGYSYGSHETSAQSHKVVHRSDGAIAQCEANPTRPLSAHSTGHPEYGVRIPILAAAQVPGANMVYAHTIGGDSRDFIQSYARRQLCEERGVAHVTRQNVAWHRVKDHFVVRLQHIVASPRAIYRFTMHEEIRYLCAMSRLDR
eukprot:scaffold415_cov362-Prasinococcus_capsulatus_cf.AAC.19